ncbi:MAG: AbrB/MazE/SpoVT family DNA-binding domain-containing protein [Candidatus Doudnabacteria bacterium]|nr:AbrB/MazE/SpoVT family DNA-binding domain-containing protein [Candidatus Doudnabacteria bacterium]
MELVAVKNKYQVVIPQKIRRSIAIKVGDYMEAREEKGSIVLTPKTILDKEIAQGLAEYKSGQFYGPFKTHSQTVKFLHKQVRKSKRKK